MSGDITLAADAIALFPDTSTPELGGAVIEFGLLLDALALATPPYIQFDRAELSFGQLTIDSIDFVIEGFVHVFSTDLSVFDPGQNEDEIARVGSVSIEFLGPLSDLGQGSIDDLRIFADRIELATARIDIPGQIGKGSSLLQFTDLGLFTTDFTFNTDFGQVAAGTIGCTAHEIDDGFDGVEQHATASSPKMGKETPLNWIVPLIRTSASSREDSELCELATRSNRSNA